MRYEGGYNPRGRGLGRYGDSLPFTPDRWIGEGSTPLIEDEDMGLRLLYKLEYLNPSGSFKDRGSALSIYYAHRMGFKRVIEDTSGNTGVSVALYSRIYGLKPYIVMPKTAPKAKKRLVKLFGGEVIEAPSRGEAPRIAEEYSGDAYYVAHTWSPLYILGSMTISFEVYDEAGVPDKMIIPVGSGGLFLGLMKGFEYLHNIGVADKIPKPIAVQGCSEQSLYRAVYGEAVEGCESRYADGILVPNPPRLEELKEYIYRYRGDVVVVDDEMIRRALGILVDKGFLVEPTSATVYAALLKAVEKGLVEKGETILLPLTGSGLKMYDEIFELVRR